MVAKWHANFSEVPAYIKFKIKDVGRYEKIGRG
jgi:hypothetical protein